MRNSRIRSSTPKSTADDAPRHHSETSNLQGSSPERRPRRVGIYERFGRSVRLPRPTTLGIVIAIVGFMLILLMMWAR
jgi:hypothetical protein